MRIVSLVPSWTEYLFDLGVGDQVVGRTKFCIHPKERTAQIPIIGGTKNIRINAIEALCPDLIIANREENVREQVEACTRFAHVLVTDISTVSEALSACVEVGRAVGHKSRGIEWRSRIEKAWGAPRSIHTEAIYLIWNDPLMAAGGGTYIHDTMKWWGISNAMKDLQRYPLLDEISSLDWRGQRRTLLLASEPFPFGEKHRRAFEAQGQRAWLVDGEAFSWYGSRMLHAHVYLNALSDRLETQNGR